MVSFLGRDQKKALKVGDIIPAFTLKDQNGNDFNIDLYRGKQPLVIYFYPKDDTPGCTKEACAFRDAYESFNDMGVKVIGISSDSVRSHKNFTEKYRLPFTLLSDPGQKVRQMFGVSGDMLGMIPGRTTYIIDKNGMIVYVFNSQFKAAKHISVALEQLKKIKNE